MGSNQGYEHSKHKLKEWEVRVPYYASVSLAILAALVIFMMFMFTDGSSLEFGRYLVDGFVWFLMSTFFYMLYVRFKTKNKNMDLKIVSLLAFIATSAKFLTSIYYTIDRFGSNLWIDAYYVAKLVVWLVLAVFFYKYWQRMRKYDFME